MSEETTPTPSDVFRKLSDEEWAFYSQFKSIIRGSLVPSQFMCNEYQENNK